MLKSLLIANRGEIARRIIRTARRLNIRTIAAYSQADAAMPFVHEADESLCIGPAAAQQSYLDGARILAAAQQSGAVAIHPGYGFLSENADFAQSVQDAGLIWVGAPPAAIRAMGRKDAAKALMIQSGVPVTPGYLGEDQSVERLKREANRVGYPVLIKAVAGGGGKGIRRVDAASDFESALASCRREAGAAFGDARVLIEAYITRPRHIEVQLFADTHGNTVHLFERDCSLQRRHQKVIEEAPAPGLDAPVRAALTAMAIAAAKAVNYVGAGTVEFIADASDGLKADRIWFMEMNTRLQVEHPVTEAITGEDLVEWQLRVASGEVLPKTQDQITMTGWGMEARLYAENPAAGFLPAIGPLTHMRLPSDIRVDSGVAQGDAVTPYYDPMIAKLVVHGRTRADAAGKLAVACAAVEVWPVKTNAGFLARTASDPDFVAGAVDTGFIERHLARLVPPTRPDADVIAVAAHALLSQAADDPGSAPWTALTGFRTGAAPDTRVAVKIGGAVHWALPVPVSASAPFSVLDLGVEGGVLFARGEAWPFSTPRPGRAAEAGSGDGTVMAPMPGTVIAIDAAPGQSVAKGARLLVLEAMKMEYVLVAPFDGVVETLSVQVGSRVQEGAGVVRIGKTD